MPVKYCSNSSCGEKIEYSALTPPSECPSCKTKFNSFFKQVIGGQQIASSISTAQAKTGSIATASWLDDPEYQAFLESKKRNIEQDNSNEDDEGSEKIDLYEVRANARLLAKEIDPDDFVISTDRSNVYKMQNLVKIEKTAIPVKKSRKSRK